MAVSLTSQQILQYFKAAHKHRVLMHLLRRTALSSICRRLSFDKTLFHQASFDSIGTVSIPHTRKNGPTKNLGKFSRNETALHPEISLKECGFIERIWEQNFLLQESSRKPDFHNCPPSQINARVLPYGSFIFTQDGTCTCHDPLYISHFQQERKLSPKPMIDSQWIFSFFDGQLSPDVRNNMVSKTEAKPCTPADEPEQKIRILIRKLKKELPMTFVHKDWHDFNMYTPEVQLLITPRRYEKPFVFRGLNQYKWMAGSFRHIFNFYLSKPSLDLLSATCYEDSRKIDIRWRVVGTPRHLRLLSTILRSERDTFIRYHDYMSVIYVNAKGKIWRHDVSKLRPSSQRLMNYLNNVRKTVTRSASAVTTYLRKSDQLRENPHRDVA